MEARRYKVICEEPNKREFPRVRWNDSVELSSRDQSTQGALSCDISQGGLKLQISQFLAIGSEMNMKVKLGSEKIIACKGTVAWVSRIAFAEEDKYHLGISFDAQSFLDDAHVDLHKFLNSNSK